MKIENITVKLFKKGGFEKASAEGSFHKKNLPVLSVVQATEGYYSFSLGDEPIAPIQEGGFFVAPAFVDQNILHHENKASGYMSARWVFMDVIVNDYLPFDALFEYTCFPDEKTANALSDIFNELFSSEDVFENKICCYKIVKLLYESATSKNAVNPHVRLALDFMNKHYKKPLSVSEIAAKVGLSPSRLYTLFKEHIGKSPNTYLNHLRLSNACMLLENTDMSVGEVAEACGINDMFYFSKLFKSKYGVSPAKYRKNITSDIRKTNA